MYRSFLWLMRSPGLPPTRYAHRESRIVPTRVLQKWMPKWMPKICEASRGDENARVLECFQ